MVKLLKEDLARSHFLPKEGLPYGGLSEAQDLSMRRIKNSIFSSGGRHALFVWSYTIHILDT